MLRREVTEKGGGIEYEWVSECQSERASEWVSVWASEWVSERVSEWVGRSDTGTPLLKSRDPQPAGREKSLQPPTFVPFFTGVAYSDRWNYLNIRLVPAHWLRLGVNLAAGAPFAVRKVSLLGCPESVFITFWMGFAYQIFYITLLSQ